MNPYYSDESVTLYHGDCREVTAWLDADVLVTDPPYGIGWRRSENSARGSAAHSGIANDSDTTTRDAAIACWGDRPGMVFGSFYAPQPANVKHVLVYRKQPDAGVVGSTTGFRRDLEPVFLIGAWPILHVKHSSLIVTASRNAGNPSSPAGRFGHPHAKPVDVMEFLILAVPPGVVADPFAGSGSTLIAARNLGRKAIGIEIEERYCEIAARRLQQGALDFGNVS